jgi:hypothetical protein
VAITLMCACGKALRVPDSAAGKRAKCPACAALLDVPAPPAPDPVFEVVDPEPEPLPEMQPRGAHAPKPKPVHADDADDGTPYGLAPEEKEETTGSNGAPKAPKRGLPNFRKGNSNYS